MNSRNSLINLINETTLHLACKSGNTDLVKYILSLNNEIIGLKTVFLIFEMMFSIDIYLVF